MQNFHEIYQKFFEISRGKIVFYIFIFIFIFLFPIASRPKSDYSVMQNLKTYVLEKYKPLVRKKTNAMYLIGGETEDLIQEGMIGLFKAVRDYQPDKDATFQTFASICVDRQIYNAIQSSNRQKHQPLNSYVSLSEQDGENEEHLGDTWVENPESIIIDQENVENLEQEITTTLSPMENQVLEYYLAGNGYGEIAELMGKTPKSIDNALRRIRTKIKEQLEQLRK